MSFIWEFFRVFLDYLLDILPYFLLALFITSFIQAYVSFSWFHKLMVRPFLAPVLTGMLGGVLPVCSCSMLPVALMINSWSRSYAPVVSFLMVAPIVSPATIILTYGLFGWKMALVRTLGTFAFALIVAYSIHFLFRKPPALSMSHREDGTSKHTLFLKSFSSNIKLLGKYILLGIIIATIIRIGTPPELVRYVSGTLLSYPLISLISIPIYVCSGEDVPIAKALMQVGFTQGNALTFMLASSGICLPTILATMGFLPKRLVLLYATCWFLLSTSIGFMYDRLIFGI